MTNTETKAPWLQSTFHRLTVTYLVVTLITSPSIFADSSEACSESIWDSFRQHFPGVIKKSSKYRCLSEENSNFLTEKDRKYYDSEDTDESFRATSIPSENLSNNVGSKIQKADVYETQQMFTTRGSDREDNLIQAIDGYISVSGTKKSN